MCKKMTMTDENDNIEVEVIDSNIPTTFVRLKVDGKEKAMIPMEEAKAILEAVESYEEDSDDTVENEDDEVPVFDGQRVGVMGRGFLQRGE